MAWSEYHARWERIWSPPDGGPRLAPGAAFDARGSSPALVHAVESGRFDVRGQHVLVPGCGRGYDLATVLQRGAAAATGLEISPTAVEEALAWLAGVGAPEASVLLHDFFEAPPAPKSGSSHAPPTRGYDYTFFCAIRPDMRGAWAEQWARYLGGQSSGGRLLTLMYPIDPNKPRDEGPPFPVTPEAYAAVLEPAGFTLEWAEDVPAERSVSGREGRERVAVWALN